MTQDEMIAIVTPLTKRSRPRIEYFISALRRIERERLPGDVVECGVWRGASIILARLICPQRICWAFDTFDGMPAPSDYDRKMDGTPARISYESKTTEGRKWAAASQMQVESNLRELGLLDPNKIKFVCGEVEKTLIETETPERVALLHLDTDWHSSIALGLEILFPRLVPGGILIVDDFGHWLGARKAVDDYFAGEAIQLERIDYTGIALTKQ